MTAARCVLFATLLACVASCDGPEDAVQGTGGGSPPPPVTPSPAPHAAFIRTAQELSRDCAGCHPAEAQVWSRSQHAHASAPVRPEAEALPTGLPGAPVAWIGVVPLRQVLVRGEGGRLVAADTALDVRDGTTFALTGAPPHEVVHDRSRTWDTQCAGCHMTGLSVRYDAATDRYDTTAAASGIACQACHVDHRVEGHPTSRVPADSACQSCHARREPLVSEPALSGPAAARQPFADRARLELADTPGLYHPDGQAADEVFEVGSLALSAMGAAGVTCNDCHEPHGGGLRAPVTDDSLCLGCHAVAATAPLATRAPDIVPTAHTHHAPEREGARCVACHMPERTYMQRDRRRDHGFTVPDPALAESIGAPDACTDCHTDRTQAQAAVEVARWWPDLPRARAHTRDRATAIARARAGDPGAAAALLAALAEESNPAWEASLLGLLGGLAPLPEAALPRARAALRSATPAVRIAAVRVLAGTPAARPRLVDLRTYDPARVVRLAAAWATQADRPVQSPLRAEVAAWLDASADQPAGARRLAAWSASDGRAADAVTWAERAAAWEPSPASWTALARATLAADRRADAQRALDAARVAATGAPASAPRPR